MDNYPIVKVLKTKDGKGYVLWCPFCNCFHCHSSIKGHHLPHCTNQNSLYLQCGGYILKEYTQKEIIMWNLPINYYPKNKK